MSTQTGDLSAINVNDSILTLKDANARQSIDEIITAIELNNTEISQRINNLNTRLETVEQTDTYTKDEADAIYDTKVEYTDLASDANAGVIKTNANKGISLNANGQLEVEGRLGKFPTTLGLFAPDDREPRNVYDYSLLLCDAKGVDLSTGRSLAIVSGYGVTCQSAAAGTTEYKLTNTYQNRLRAKCCENGYIALDEATSKIQMIEPVLSVTINGKTFNPDSSADSSTPIIIRVSNSVNPTSSTTSIRLFGKMQSYASAHIGNGISTTGGGRSLILGGAVTKAAGNDNCMVGMEMYSTGNGNAMFGRFHIARKNRSFLAGTGHDTTNARSEAASAIGEYSSIDSNTLFAVGNGTSATARSNAFEVRNDGLVLKSPNGNRWLISVDNDGNLTTSAL